MANSTDLKDALKSINDKKDDYDALYSYYDGNPSLKYSTQRLRRAFNNVFVYFAQNWAGVIINSVLDRLILKGFDANDDSLNNKMDELFNKMNMNLDAQDINEALQVTGEAFLIVDKVEDNIDVYFNDPRLCEMFYDANRPKLKSFAAKKWTGSDGFVHLNLYYADRTDKYVSEKGTTPQSFSLAETVKNELGIIPVFHFRNSRRIIKGELDQSTISMLDSINKLFSDLMVAAEFETFKTKLFISQVDPGDINIGPDMKMWIPARETGTGEDTKVIELGGTDLENFLKPINDLANSLAVQTNTPKYYFFSQTQAPSGESLLVMESGLVKKIQKKQEAYSPVWSEVMSYVLKLMGLEVSSNDIEVLWEPAGSSIPLTEAQIFQTEKLAGIPTINTARRLGFDEQSITQLEADLNSQPVNTPIV